MKNISFKFRTLIVCFIVLQACGDSKSQVPAGEMPITQLEATQLSEGAVLLDVRTPKEYAAGHLEGAVNMDIFSDDFTTQLQELDKDATVYVYCKKGGRSARAAALMDSLGYSHVIDLTGGYDAYKAAQQ
ncbi:Rhodanese-related sulfurtransferase [Robiginitalea myxolifaciens]|uniref:Rhodanese-related sulfurtransferase n=1 Tax=Robiginitalea myxolifaciens TaxID=400055 RepID=A0A1I6HIS5_9FLAO|nr:rhodanese-like domain-containing protein [Robiginitalea myxolifaciens]SFR54306.1 Rhodanese-related sulfurtransferase [Robiginitalea myxolifaciens]